MAQTAQYFKRAPRYLLTSIDDVDMRVAPMTRKGQALSTRLHDLSETGLAFTMAKGASDHDPDNGLSEGDMIKIEFTVPGRKQIACFATVVRIEDRAEWSPEYGDSQFTMVAVQYRNLPTLHRRTLELGLKGRVNEDPEFNWNTARREQLFMLMTLGIAQLLVLWYMAQPPEAWISPLRLLLSF